MPRKGLKLAHLIIATTSVGLWYIKANFLFPAQLAHEIEIQNKTNKTFPDYKTKYLQTQINSPIN